MYIPDKKEKMGQKAMRKEMILRKRRGDMMTKSI
jgi:hypothetical protein